MAYYVSYKASEELKYRSRIARRLRSMGCERICRSFWRVDRENIRSVASMLQGNSRVILKRRREIRKPSLVGGRLSELGSLIVIAYKVPKEVNRARIKNFLRRAPCIRLSRGVYAFCQEHERFGGDRRLVDAGSFWLFIQEIDQDAVILPRMIVVNSGCVGRLLEEARKRVEREVDSIIERYKSLYRKAETSQIDVQSVASTSQKLRKRFTTAKKVARFYEEWLKMDLSNILVKPYPAIRRVRSLLSEG